MHLIYIAWQPTQYNETRSAPSRCARFDGYRFTEVLLKPMVYGLAARAC
jgi:hypothetical protein